MMDCFEVMYEEGADHPKLMSLALHDRLTGRPGRITGPVKLLDRIGLIGANEPNLVTETAHWLEWQDWGNPILQQPYEVKDGKLHIPDVPGVGLEWDEKAVAAHLVDNF